MGWSSKAGRVNYINCTLNHLSSLANIRAFVVDGLGLSDVLFK
jgi:hypothetical protein